MAVNESRSMNGDFHQGCIDNTYIQLTPNRGGIVENPPVERLTEPQFRNVGLWPDNPFGESRVGRLHLPRERKTSDSGEIRY